MWYLLEFHRKLQLIMTALDEMANPEIRAGATSTKPEIRSCLIPRCNWWLILTILVNLYFGFLIESIREEHGQAEESNLHNSDAGSIDLDGVSPFDMKIQLWIGIVEPTWKIMEAQLYLIPSRRFLDAENGGTRCDLLLDYGGKKELLDRDQALKSRSITIPINSGSSFIYPFEVFRSELNMRISKLPDLNPVSIRIEIMASAPAMWFEVIRLDKNSSRANQSSAIASGSGFTSYGIIISRPKNVIVFSVFVVIILWLLSISVVANAGPLNDLCYA